MNIHVIICSVLTFIVMSAFAMFMQWVNAQWSVFGTAPIVAVILIAALLIHRWEKKNVSLLTGKPLDPVRWRSRRER